MQDMKASAEKLRAEADNAEQIARSATDLRKRQLYERLAVHFRQLSAPAAAPKNKKSNRQHQQ
jgi:hypothetical protein